MIEPSRYQKAIFDYIRHEHGHLTIEAVAGSGKTTTLLLALDFINPSLSVLITAFNRDIVNEIAKKTTEFPNVTTKTIHSIGYSMIRRNGYSPVVDEYKYETHIKGNIKEYSSIKPMGLPNDMFTRYVDNVLQYVNFGRMYLCQTVNDLKLIEGRYAIDTIADEKEIAVRVMDWGKENLGSIDYTDMVWIPNILSMNAIGLQYDFIMLDECQDVNRAERNLVLKCMRMGTRIIAVGDRNQCLYSFAGADPYSFDEFLAMPNMKALPLSISYRCAKNIVNLAKTIVPEIEPNDDGREGDIERNSSLDDASDGDMVICRRNAPLMWAYTKLLKEKKKAYFIGKDIGENLKRVVKNANKEEISLSLTSDGLIPLLYKDLFDTREKLMKMSSIDEDTAMQSMIITNKLDIIKSIEILSYDLKTTKDLLSRIDEIFSANKGEGVLISTIHKSKGLEADKVYIIEDNVPKRPNRQQWEITQEKNLVYVAYTRAKNHLRMIPPDLIYEDNPQRVKADMKHKEACVALIYGRHDFKVDETNAAAIVARAAKISATTKNPNVTDIDMKMPKTTLGRKRRKNPIKFSD